MKRALDVDDEGQKSKFKLQIEMNNENQKTVTEVMVTMRDENDNSPVFVEKHPVVVEVKENAKGGIYRPPTPPFI